jgi:hypothetical protein
MIPRSIRLLVTSTVLVACSSSTPADAPASTTPSQASAAPTSAATSVAETSQPSATAAVLPTSVMIKMPEYEGVVLAVKSVSQTGMTSVGKAQLDGVWVPNAGDVAAFESGLAAHMTKSVPAASKALPAKLKSYKRQWFGVTAGSKKLIYGNFLCEAQPGWDQAVIMVDDGGDCYFQLFYDVASREYLGLVINGNA